MGKRAKKEKRIFVADSETDPFKKGRVPVPFLWGLYDGVNYEEFETVESFIRYVSDIECIIYAHNGGKFDWHFIVDYIEFGTELMIINGRLAKFKIGLAEFRDSWNILPVPLAAMQKTVIDYGIFEVEERNKPENMRAIKAYLYDDCRFLFDYLTAFFERFGSHLTLAGCAMSTWQSMTQREAPKDAEGAIYDQFERFYYGGRCEVFESGVFDEWLGMVDICSAYPRAMLDDHPFSLDFDRLSGDELRDMGRDIPGQCFLTVSGPARGALPFRAKDGALSFPADNIVRTFHITGWEFSALRETVGDTGYFIHEGFEFRENINFADFILPLYSERLECKARDDKKGDLIAKLCMNSLYGKFASNPRNYSKYIAIDPTKIDDDVKLGHDLNYEWHFAGYLGEMALGAKDVPEYEERFYNVATSASITGWTRAYLWRAICKCEGVIYCDTDSIIARDVSALSTGNELGDWQIERAFKRGGVAGKKLYAFEDYTGYKKTASKGAKLSYDDIINVVCGGDVFIYEPEAPSFSVHHPPTFVNRKIKSTIKKK